MVKNYRNINDDLKVVLSLARDKLAEDAREARTHPQPILILARIDHNLECIHRLEHAIKS